MAPPETMGSTPRVFDAGIEGGKACERRVTEQCVRRAASGGVDNPPAGASARGLLPHHLPHVLGRRACALARVCAPPSPGPYCRARVGGYIHCICAPVPVLSGAVRVRQLLLGRGGATPLACGTRMCDPLCVHTRKLLSRLRRTVASRCSVSRGPGLSITARLRDSRKLAGRVVRRRVEGGGVHRVDAFARLPYTNNPADA